MAVPSAPLRTEVLVVGSGIAGLTAALAAAERSEVLLVTKGALSEGATRRAQGGIAAAVDPADDPDAHARDTLAAGAGLGDAEAVRVLCTQGPAAIAELIAAGVDFDRAADGSFALGLEGAHGRPRILHAGGDATGRAIQDALVRATRARAADGARGRITLLEHTALADLQVVRGQVVGAELLAADGIRRRVRARSTVLATGGAGQLFSHTTNPAGATGDGIAAAWRAGAALEDLEFYQFHPTALSVQGPHARFLISEAVRGEGALLRDAQGRRFLPAVDARAELAPRDVVARAIARVMAAQGGLPVLLDATGIGAERLRRRFPTIDAAVRAAGIDWGREPVPVTPAAHYWMGGIRTDLEGRTTLPGLYAVGECARTGVHGANRLASNSLLEGAVFGARVGAAAATRVGRGTSAAGPSTTGAAPAVEVATAEETTGAKPPPRAVTGRAWERTALQELLWSHAGLLRSGAALETAAAELATWRALDPSVLTTVCELEDRNLLDLSRLLLAHALARPDSVGVHHRLDEPGTATIPHPVPSLDLTTEAPAC